MDGFWCIIKSSLSLQLHTPSLGSNAYSHKPISVIILVSCLIIFNNAQILNSLCALFFPKDKKHVKDQVVHNKPLSIYVLRDHTRSIEKEFLVTYSVMGLSSPDLQQFLSDLQILEENTVQLLWAGKELTRGKKLCDFIGRNEKTKIVIRLQSLIPPPASLSGGEKS
ncbi:cilia- and flagella-associated protein 298-B isoform X2 [Capsicum annuum]|uniref:cilia- and flagella-associated protein 298-B isoform X2 n=1 Tax=Capsicum annuum TaxID=4072 RepID=UPI001FB06DA3|nr:cilia- and flagella-associated protein 298-B isoform X2 [Capsicum annuum]